MKRFGWVAIGLLVALSNCGPKFRETNRKVVILGFDGVDPDLVRQFIGEGVLPNLAELQKQGTLMDLGTTCPPESPVAWASFHTGTNPGKHGIFDFLRRSPKTYFPNIATVDKVEPEFLFSLFPWRLPRAISLMKGTPFWKTIADSGIRTIILQAPVIFPPIELPGGYMTSGLTTPDIRGTQATYHFYSTDVASEKAEDTEFGGKVTGLTLREGRAETKIIGPWDPVVRQEKKESRKRLREIEKKLRKDSSDSSALRDEKNSLKERLRELEDHRYIEVPLKFEVDISSKSVVIQLQGQRQTVLEGTWSNWLDVRFQVTPLISIYGICKFYPREIGDQVRIYMSPIEFDPRNPPLPISYPSGFTAELASEVGLYKTRGWAAESAALKELKIDEKAYIEDQMEIIEKREAITLYTLKNKPWSLFISVFSAPDRTQHMFWRLIDPKHSLYDPKLVEKYGTTIRRIYQRMDETIGKVRALLGPDTILFICSDHGFHSFRTGLNINTWLAENGFLFLKGQAGHRMNLRDLYTQKNFFLNVDWSRTQAYSLGLGLIFINLQGRESRGIVAPGEEYDRVKRDISDGLKALIDPEFGANVVDNVYDTAKVYFGPEVGNAPDLIVGFAEGYRVSWQTALGAIPPGVLVVNDQKWSGDHCSVDAKTTSGFLVSNRKLGKTTANIVDIAPTILGLFGINPPAELDGEAILEP